MSEKKDQKPSDWVIVLTDRRLFIINQVRSDIKKAYKVLLFKIQEVKAYPSQ